MSVIDTVKEKVPIGESAPRYRCDACGAEFESGTEPGSYWFSCPECDADEATRLD